MMKVIENNLLRTTCLPGKKMRPGLGGADTNVIR